MAPSFGTAKPSGPPSLIQMSDTDENHGAIGASPETIRFFKASFESTSARKFFALSESSLKAWSGHAGQSGQVQLRLDERSHHAMYAVEFTRSHQVIHRPAWGSWVTDLNDTLSGIWCLLPEGSVGYFSFVGAYAPSVVVGLISHVPGGVGVFGSSSTSGFA